MTNPNRLPTDLLRPCDAEAMTAVCIDAGGPCNCEQDNYIR